MKYRLFAYLIAVTLIFSCLLSACGEKPSDVAADDASADSAVVKETTVVLETTADGDSIELDSEGNKITKDKNGEIISVVDKNGKTIEVTEYITTHHWIIESNDADSSAGKNSGSGTSSEKSSSQSGSKPAASSSSGSSSASSDNDGEDVEGDIPVIIATIPDDEDMIELPDL